MLLSKNAVMRDRSSSTVGDYATVNISKRSQYKSTLPVDPDGNGALNGGLISNRVRAPDSQLGGWSDEVKLKKWAGIRRLAEMERTCRCNAVAVVAPAASRLPFPRRYRVCRKASRRACAACSYARIRVARFSTIRAGRKSAPACRRCRKCVASASLHANSR